VAGEGDEEDRENGVCDAQAGDGEIWVPWACWRVEDLGATCPAGRVGDGGGGA
jgi:hypothetical protein